MTTSEALKQGPFFFGHTVVFKYYPSELSTTIFLRTFTTIDKAILNNGAKHFKRFSY